MKRYIKSSYYEINDTIDKELLTNALDTAKEYLDSTGESKYQSIMNQLEDALSWDEDTYSEGEFGALVRRWISFCLTGEDPAEHFIDSKFDENEYDDSEDAWNPYNGNIGVFSTHSPMGEFVGNDRYFKDGQEGQAIRYWFQEGAKYPTCTAIVALGYQGQNIRDWASKNWDKIDKWAQEYGCPYKLDYILEQCQKKQRISESSYPDQIYPFCFG